MAKSQNSFLNSISYANKGTAYDKATKADKALAGYTKLTPVTSSESTSTTKDTTVVGRAAAAEAAKAAQAAKKTNTAAEAANTKTAAAQPAATAADTKQNTDTASYTSSGYNNGGLTTDQVKEMQSYYGTAADGLWGNNSETAAGGLDAASAWQQYQAALQEQLSYQPEVMSYEDYLDQTGYDTYADEVKKAIAAQVQSAVDSYNDQITESEADYQEAARQAYIAKMLSQRNMDQELAANGVYGGTADSQRIAQETDYQNNLNDLATEYQSTIAKLKRAITDAQLTGDTTVAQAMADYLSQVQSSYASYVNNQQSIAAQAQADAQALAQQYALENQYSTGRTTGSDTGGDDTGLGNYEAVKNVITNFAKQGNTQRVQEKLDEYYSSMSEAQKQEVMSILASYGYNAE